MSSVKDECKERENFKQDREKLTDKINSHRKSCDCDSDIKKESLGSFVIYSHFESGEVAQDCNNSAQISTEIDESYVQNTLIKSEENTADSKSEKRRSVSLLRNEPPPLIHYLQDKEAPEIDDDNSPPRLLPEVIVTRTKLHREKSQSFKISVARNLQKSKRKLSMKHSSSLSDDQTSNESHEHFLSYADISQCSSTASGILKKGIVVSPEKHKSSKQSNHCEKSQRMGISPDAVRTLPKFPSCNGTSCFSSDGEQERNVGKSRPASSESGVEELEREGSLHLGNEVDFESWLTETEEEEEDDDAIFVVPPQISTGKEERDRIDGIEFLGFETEHDMVEFTKIEQDYRGEGLQSEENIIHSDDGLDMMDDSYHYSESETPSASPAIVPTKTKDITKIKGWRTKTFAINNNPSEGQCSSSSIGPYEDDDGFVSCDIKIEEDASLDMEEQGYSWTAGVQDLFMHDKLPIGNCSVGSITKELKDSTSNKTEKRWMGTDETFSNIEDHTRKVKNENVHFENLTYGTGRYPKRHSTTVNKNTSAHKKEVGNISPTHSDFPEKVPKKRGRKPKTVAEKRLMLQLANQYKTRRKRGRPKGSGKKSNIQQKESAVTEVVYNLRNKSKREEQISDKSSELNSSSDSARNMEITEKTSRMQPLNNQKVESITSKLNSKLVSVQKKYLSSEVNIHEGNENSSTHFSSLKNSQEEQIEFIDYPLRTLNSDGPITSNITPISTSNTLTTTSTPTSLPVPMTSSTVTLTYPPEKINFTSNTSSSEITIASTLVSSGVDSSNTDISSSIPSSSMATTVTTNSVAITFAELPTLSNASENASCIWKKINENDKIKQTHSGDSNLVDKSFEYGLILSTGIRRPLVALAMDQLKTLRENNHNIDEHWAKFAASVVVTKTMKTTLQSNTVILPVRAFRLPFMSFTPNPASKDPHQLLTDNTKRQSIVPKFDPMTGSSVRVRCPRPLTQVGVRTIPSILKRQNLEHDYHMGVKWPRKSMVFGGEQRKQQEIGNITNHILKREDDEIRKVVEDLLNYVERREARDIVIHEEPRALSLNIESSNVNENIVLKRKKGPMIRELSRLDVNVIEMWDAGNKKCTEEHCKLGCICESLECCKPAIEQHCGKEECMFNCECEPKSYKRGESRQHTLLSPLTLLTIPQQNRRILAKEEKEFQQTVIRAKHETIVVNCNGNNRRKREIKLPGRYRDSYVALGKEYGLVDFKINSDECVDPSVRRLARISVVNNRELIQGIAPKPNSGVTKVPWEVKVSEMKLQYGVKECFVKLERSNCVLTTTQQKENEVLKASPEGIIQQEQHENNSQMFEEKSRNMAVKSTTLPPNLWYDPKYFAARTAPINIKLLKRYKNNRAGKNHQSMLIENNVIASTSIPVAEEAPPNLSYLDQNICMSSTSDFVLDDGPLNFGKIESVTTLSEEQFQKGDLTFGIEQFETQSVCATVEGMRANISDKTFKGKTNSNISIDKIANLLNRKIRELKEKGGNVSFPAGNEESIHLLQWPVLKTLFQTRSIQLWYYNGGSKLVITSTKLRPDPSFVNLNDVSEQQYKQLPPIVSDLFRSESRKKQLHRDIYALLHFDGKHVELVGTIYKNRSTSEQSHTSAPKDVKLLTESNKDKLCLKSDKPPVVDVPSSSSPDIIYTGSKIGGKLKHGFTNQEHTEQVKSRVLIKLSTTNPPEIINPNLIKNENRILAVQSSNMNVKSLGRVNRSPFVNEASCPEINLCDESISLEHINKTSMENETSISKNKSFAVNTNSQELEKKNLYGKEKPHLSSITPYIITNSPRFVNECPVDKEKHVLVMKQSTLNGNSQKGEKKTSEKDKQLSVVTLLNEKMPSQGFVNQNYCAKEKSLSVSKITDLNSPVSVSQIPIENEKCSVATKSSLLNTNLTMKQVETKKGKSPSSLKKLSNLNVPSLSPNKVSRANNATCSQIQSSVTKCDIRSGTRIRKLKTVWQSTKVQTAEGENVPIPLPSCAGDSRWFVLNVSKPFDVLHITSKDCSARHKHISETIKMASSHKKTVRLPLQVSSKNLVCENPNQPKFGIYAVPHISSYVFIGPYGLNEDPSITKSVLCDGKYRTIIDLDDEGDESPGKASNDNLGQDYSEKAVGILRKICRRPSGHQKEINSWLYTKRNCGNEASRTQKENSLPKNSTKIPPENTSFNDNKTCPLKIGGSSNNNINNGHKKEIPVTGVDKVASTLCNASAEQEQDKYKNTKNTESESNLVTKQDNVNSVKNKKDTFNVSSTSKVSKITGSSQNQEASVKDTTKRNSEDIHGEIFKKLYININKSLSNEEADIFNKKSNLAIPSWVTPNSSSSQSPKTKKKTSVSSSSPKKQVSSAAKKPCLSAKSSMLKPDPLKPDPQKLHTQPQQDCHAGWLVPSFSWIGCIACTYNREGDLFFSHPVTKMKMTFTNLESTQLWLDRLFQSAILYIPRHLFVTWSLQTNSEDVLKEFDSSVLNGNYMMTVKGIFDIDKLVATEAESYGLKPIEVLRLQDKKSRRDLELGIYQLKRALDDNDPPISPCTSKLDLLSKAVAEIEILDQTARELDRNIKKRKIVKHKSLLNLYNMMKGLPINKKRDIVQKLKIQYDLAEDTNRTPIEVPEVPNDGFVFSMARYCGCTQTFPRSADESDIDDYLSEYDEDVEDSCENVNSSTKKTNCSSLQGESENQTTNIETTKSTRDNKTKLKGSDDEEESVSISVVTSQNVNEVKDIDNSDEITVTCLNNFRDGKNSLCASTSRQSSDSSVNTNERMCRSTTGVLTSPQITLKPLTSPVKTIPSEEVKNSIHYTLAMKRKLVDSSYETVSGELQNKKVKVHYPCETSQLNSGFDSLFIKKYKTVTVDSVPQDNDSPTKTTATGSIGENTQMNSSKVTTPNTLFVNVVSSNQSKIVPLRVDDKVKSCGTNFGTVHVPSSTSLPNRALKIIRKDVKPVYVQGPRGTLPLLVTSHPSTIVPTSCSVLSSTSIQQSLPVLSVKKVSKDSIPPGVEPRPATILPPPLVPIIDKKQAKTLSEHTTQLLTAIAPLPTLIKMVDGMPAEKGS